MNDQQFKADGGKANPALLEVGCVRALEIVQATLDYGAQKYEAHSWRRVPDGETRYDNAARRHRIARDKGELFDKESGLLHMAHEVTCLLFQMELLLERIDPAMQDNWTAFNQPPQDHKIERKREHDDSIHAAVDKIATTVKLAATEPFAQPVPPLHPVNVLMLQEHQQAQSKASGPDVPYTTGRASVRGPNIQQISQRSNEFAAVKHALVRHSVEDAFAVSEDGYHIG